MLAFIFKKRGSEMKTLKIFIIIELVVLANLILFFPLYILYKHPNEVTEVHIDFPYVDQENLYYEEVLPIIYKDMEEYYNSKYPYNIVSLVEKYKGDIPKEVIYAVIGIETGGGGNIPSFSLESALKVISNTGDIGIMQINPKGGLAEWNRLNPQEKYSIKDLHDPEICIKIGAWLLNLYWNMYLYKYYSSPEEGIHHLYACYNAGPKCKTKEGFYRYSKKYQKRLQRVTVYYEHVSSNIFDDFYIGLNKKGF